MTYELQYKDRYGNWEPAAESDAACRGDNVSNLIDLSDHLEKEWSNEQVEWRIIAVATSEEVWGWTAVDRGQDAQQESESMATVIHLNEKFDGTVVVDGETVLVHNALAQSRDIGDEDYQPSAAAVEAAQRAVDESYSRRVR